MQFLKLLSLCKSRVHVSSWKLSCIRIKLGCFESSLSFISGIPEIAWGKTLWPKYLHVISFMVCAFALALGETALWWIVGFFPVCVSFEIHNRRLVYFGPVEIICWDDLIASKWNWCVLVLSWVLRTAVLHCSVALWMRVCRRVDEAQKDNSGYIWLYLWLHESNYWNFSMC